MYRKDELVEAVLSCDQSELYSPAEIRILFDINDNTFKGHFSGNRFAPLPENKDVKGKKNRGVDVIKRYAVWLYLGEESDGAVYLKSYDRDDFLNSNPVSAIWNAFLADDEGVSFYQMVQVYKNHKQIAVA